MIEIEYVISDGFRCDHNIIEIGGLGYNKLKNQDKDQYISDTLTHEFIHVLLGDIFDDITSCLFDFIGDSLLNTRILKRVTYLTPGNELWSIIAQREGIKFIYNNYMIDNIDLIQSYLVCNWRLKNEA